MALVNIKESWYPPTSKPQPFTGLQQSVYANFI